MRVLFIESPPSINWNPSSSLRTGGRRHPSQTVGEMTYSPINLSAAEICRINGFEVKYIHAQSEEKGIKQIEKDIKGFSPNLTVFDVHAIKMGVDEYLSYLAKKHGSKVVWVGSFATAMHKELICNSFVDYIVRGEWDASVAGLAKYGDRTWGVTWKTKTGNIKLNRDMPLIKDLDKLPIPAYDLIDLRKFKESVFLKEPCATTFSSRGCFYKCVFCTFPSTLFGSVVRGQSPERVLTEAIYLISEYGVKDIRYDDDLFEYDKKRVFEICDLFKKELPDLVWSNQMRCDVNRDMADALKTGGCHKILFGVESGSDYVLKMMRKGITVDQIVKGQENVRKADIDRHNCFLLGSIWDDQKTTKQTIDFAFKLGAEFSQFSVMTGFPGAPYYDMIKPYMVTNDWSDIDSFHNTEVNLPNLSKEFLDEQLRDIYKRYYLRPSHMFKMAKRSLKSLDHMKQTIRLVKVFNQRRKLGWN